MPYYTALFQVSQLRTRRTWIYERVYLGIVKAESGAGGDEGDGGPREQMQTKRFPSTYIKHT